MPTRSSAKYKRLSGRQTVHRMVCSTEPPSRPIEPRSETPQKDGFLVKGVRHYSSSGDCPVTTRLSKHLSVTATETILVVEDDDIVRRVVCKVLKDCGYTVLESRNGIEAILTCQCHQGPIHLVLTDIVMPHLSGQQLASRLHASVGQVNILYMSGYDIFPSEKNDSGAESDELQSRSDFLAKPFTPDILRTKVREFLDRSSVHPS